DCAPRVTNFKASVQNQPVKVGVSDIDASTNAQRPDAGKITDGITASPGHSAADTTYVIILPHNGSYGALTIDLGAVMTICGTGSGCTAPTIQADNDDVYELDYLNSSGSWIKFGQFPTVSSNGLQTRSLKGSDFQARYVRVWGISGGNTYSVS